MNMNIVRWDPFRELSQLIDRDAFVGANANGNVHRWQPLVDIRETKDAYAHQQAAAGADRVRHRAQEGVCAVRVEVAVLEPGKNAKRERDATGGGSSSAAV